jgi:hypothetical protein
MATVVVTTRRRGTWAAVVTIAPLTARNVLTTGFTSAKGTWRGGLLPVDAAVTALEGACPPVMTVVAII